MSSVHSTERPKKKQKSFTERIFPTIAGAIAGAGGVLIYKGSRPTPPSSSSFVPTILAGGTALGAYLYGGQLSDIMSSYYKEAPKVIEEATKVAKTNRIKGLFNSGLISIGSGISYLGDKISSFGSSFHTNLFSELGKTCGKDMGSSAAAKQLGTTLYNVGSMATDKAGTVTSMLFSAPSTFKGMASQASSFIGEKAPMIFSK